jgi:hypothetical protein
MSNLKPIIDKLKKYDFVGFGCTGHLCTNGRMKPSNGVLASKRNSILMKNVLDELDKKLDIKNSEYNYFDLGKLVIWKELNKLVKDGYDYYHYDSAYDGTRKKNKRWLRPENYFDMDTEVLDEDKLFFILLTNSGLNHDNKYKVTFEKFLKMNQSDILKQEYWISKMFRKSLNL